MGDENGSTTSSKRKWNPCTWRYAIEDSQADQLHHKPRPWPRAECKDARSGYGCPELPDHPHRQHQASLNSNRQPPGAYGLHHRAAASLLKKAQTQAPALVPATEPRDPIITCNNDNSGSRSPPQKNSPETDAINRNPIKAARGKAAKLPTPSKQLSSTSEETEHRGQHHYYSLSSDADSRSKREMSPTELYFCDICSGRTANTEIPAV